MIMLGLTAVNYNNSTVWEYCKTLIFCCILISLFWSLENLRHFNFSFLLLPSSPLNLLLSALFWCGFDSPTDTPVQPHCLMWLWQPNRHTSSTSLFADATSARFSIFFFSLSVWQTQNYLFFNQRKLFTFTMRILVFYADEILVMGVV